MAFHLGPAALEIPAGWGCWLPSRADETATILGPAVVTVAPPPGGDLLLAATDVWTTLALLAPLRMLGFFEGGSSEA